jgi:hypothetical protein
MSFFAGVRGEAPRDAAVDGGLPQVALGGERDYISMDGGEAVVAAVLLGETEGEERRQE